MKDPVLHVCGKHASTYYNLKNRILKKTAMNSINIYEHQIYTFIYVYDKILITHHISSSNLPQHDLTRND